MAIVTISITMDTEEDAADVSGALSYWIPAVANLLGLRMGNLAYINPSAREVVIDFYSSSISTAVITEVPFPADVRWANTLVRGRVSLNASNFRDGLRLFYRILANQLL